VVIVFISSDRNALNSQCKFILLTVRARFDLQIHDGADPGESVGKIPKQRALAHTHPFHPLKGQRFAILKIRRVAGREVLSLYDDKRGSLPFPSDWTDQAVRSAWSGADLDRGST
jgi:hypothetical protein